MHFVLEFHVMVQVEQSVLPACSALGEGCQLQVVTVRGSIVWPQLFSIDWSLPEAKRMWFIYFTEYYQSIVYLPSFV
jgi:hypothetical protein